MSNVAPSIRNAMRRPLAPDGNPIANNWKEDSNGQNYARKLGPSAPQAGSRFEQGIKQPRSHRFGRGA